MLYPLSYGGCAGRHSTKVRRNRIIAVSACPQRQGGSGKFERVTASSPKILVVDDSEVIRTLISVNLELEGFCVHTAGDGLECLDLAARLRPDVITLDVAMPRLDGFETLQRLRARDETASIPVVMVSARAQGRDIRRGRQLGADEYITKPFEPEELVATVRKLCTGGQGGAPPP